MKVCVCGLLLIISLVAAFSIEAQKKASIASQPADACFPGTCYFTGNPSAINQLRVQVDSSPIGSCFPHGSSALQLLNLGPSTVFYSFHRTFFTALGGEASPDPPPGAAPAAAPTPGSIAANALLKVGCFEDNNGLVDSAFQQWFITYAICADFSSSACATATGPPQPGPPQPSCVPRNPVIAACAATTIANRP